MNRLLSLKKTPYFLLLTVITIIYSLAMRYFLQTDELYFQSYAEQLTVGQIQEIIAHARLPILQYITCAIIPLVIIIRVFFTGFCFQVGSLVQEYHWKWNDMYNIALKADIVYSFGIASNLYYYGFYCPPKNLSDLSVNFLSLLKLKGIENVPTWLVMALNSVNVFELLYIVLLTALVRENFHIKYSESVVFVLLTYVVGYYFYIIAMTFVYLNFAQ